MTSTVSGTLQGVETLKTLIKKPPFYGNDFFDENTNKN